MDRPVQAMNRAEHLTVACPVCDAAPAHPCLGQSTHTPRVKLAQEQARAAIAPAPYHRDAPEAPAPIPEVERQAGRRVIDAIRREHGWRKPASDDDTPRPREGLQ